MHQVLKAGQSMIGLQYGTNKGASQVSNFSKYSTKKERSMKKRAGKYFFRVCHRKIVKFFHFSRLVWLPMEPPGRSDQRVSFIQHLSSTFDTKLYSSRFWSGVIFHHIVIIFWHPNTSSNYLIELPIKQTRCSCQWKYVNKSYCGLLRSNEDTAACFAIVCLFVYISLAFAGHSASKDASTATLAGAYLPHSASERS